MRRHSNSVEKRTKVKEIIEHNKNSNQKRTHNTTYYMETVSHTHSYKIVKKKNAVKNIMQRPKCAQHLMLAMNDERILMGEKSVKDTEVVEHWWKCVVTPE